MTVSFHQKKFGWKLPSHSLLYTFSKIPNILWLIWVLLFFKTGKRGEGDFHYVHGLYIFSSKGSWEKLRIHWMSPQVHLESKVSCSSLVLKWQTIFSLKESPHWTRPVLINDKHSSIDKYYDMLLLERCLPQGYASEKDHRTSNEKKMLKNGKDW